MTAFLPSIANLLYLAAGVLLTVAVPQVFKGGAALIAWAKAKFSKTPQE